MPLVVLLGCGASKSASPNERDEAWEKMGAIRANSSAKDVALTNAERDRLYKRVELDTLGHTENTTLLLAVAYRNPEEKARLFQRVPVWFKSENLSTRCMAFRIVKFLKERGYEQESSSLLKDLESRASSDAEERFMIEDLQDYTQAR